MALTVLLSIGVEEDRGHQEEGNIYHGGEESEQWNKEQQNTPKDVTGRREIKESGGEP